MDLHTEPLSLLKKRKTLAHITDLLNAAGIDYVVGGSGMLLGLQLTNDIRDWDLMTDAAESEVSEALAGVAFTVDRERSELYASGCKLQIQHTVPEVEIIIGFSLYAEGQVCKMPALSGGVREGLPIASPEVWWTAYTLMGRHEKAELLAHYLNQHGADQQAIERLIEEPLPEQLVRKLEQFPTFLK
ncbi:hypothetical protein [Saccharibacillus sp. JS10]|uniref:hypothetical protein n=1 Tax=Saccharibacillus sp. JS10 TaxID=2950552 RepID=UPI00210E728C|nr:hypothetical protein [Saccharibacillus sp. JS10]MCQ4085660.1 hypothetical protein [Saccharibacillus sp. JS10]